MITVDQDNISKILLDEFNSKKEKNSRFSMRSFASQLGINSGALSQILNGKRRISKKQALKFMEVLDLTDEQRDAILEPFLIEDKLKDESNKERVLFDHHKFSSNDLWKVLAILNLVKTKNFKLSVKYIANRLGLEEKETNDLMTKIFAQKLLIFTKEGRLKRSNQTLCTTDNEADYSLKMSHKINCELASSALDNTQIEERDFTSVTFPMNGEKMDEARKKIRDFQKELCALLETGTCQEVYKLNVQLYPLTKSEEK